MASGVLWVGWSVPKITSESSAYLVSFKASLKMKDFIEKGFFVIPHVTLPYRFTSIQKSNM